VKRGEELGIVRGDENKRDRVNQRLCLVRGGFDEIPRGVAYRKGLVQPRGNGSEIRGVSGGGGVKVSAEQ